MNKTTSTRTRWIQNGLFIGLMLALLFTDLGPWALGGMQQLLLKTGLKNAPAATTEIPATPTQATGSYPHQLALTTLDGQPVQLSDLKGKVVFLNQWATWCPPCRAEMPAIEKLYQSVDKNKVAFVMLSLDEDAQKARQFVADQGFTFPVYVPGGPLPDSFNAQVVPTTLILGPDGQLSQRIEGMTNFDTDDFRQYLVSLQATGK